MMNFGFETDEMDNSGIPPLDASKLLRTIRGLNAALKSHLTTIDPNTPLAEDNVADVKKDVVPAQKPSSFDSSKEHIKLAHKMTVSIRILFMKINVIDTIHDRFSAEVLIQNRWREPQLDGCKSSSEEVEWDKYWNPRLVIENAIGEPRDIAHMSFSLDNNGRATVCESRQVTGNFFEFMELDKFPFDSQDLTVTLVSERGVSEVQLSDYEDEKSGVSTGDFSAAQEWLLHPIVNIWTKVNSKKVNNVVTNYPAFSVAAKASRRPQFFIWNIITVMFLICSLAFASFTCDVRQPQFRLQLTFILLLTTVTFKFAVNKNIPRISYLTYMDKYILGTMFILFSCCIWHCFVSVIYENTQSSGVTSQNATVTTAAAPAAPKAITTGNYTLFSTRAFIMTTATTTNVTTAASAATTLAPASPTTVLSDSIALGVFLTVYMAFHLVFLMLILCEMNSDQTSTNIEVDQISDAGGDKQSDLHSTIFEEDDKTIIRSNRNDNARPLSGTGPTGRRASARARSNRGDARDIMPLSDNTSTST